MDGNRLTSRSPSSLPITTSAVASASAIAHELEMTVALMTPLAAGLPVQGSNMWLYRFPLFPTRRSSLASVILTVALYVTVRNYIQGAIHQRLIDVVSVAALQVNADADAALNNPEQENSSEYLQIKRILQRIRDTNPSIRYIYTMRYIPEGQGSPDQEMFVVDAENDPALVSHLGDIYEEALPSSLGLMAVADQPYIEPEISEDRWGTWITGCAPLFLSNGERGDFLCIDMAASELFSQERQFLWTALAFLAGMLPFVLVIGWWLGNRLAAPIGELVTGVERLAKGDLQYRVKVSTRDETGFLARTFNSMVDRINGLYATLRQQIDERTREVERRSNYLAATEEVGRMAYSTLDTDRLLQQVTELIRTQFKLYYVGLFSVSEDGKWAVLRTGTGKAGQMLMERQHRIPVGEGMVGWCITNARSRVAPEVVQGVVHIENPTLPETRSEAALPLRVRGRILGALTVQSECSNAFDETAMLALQTIADQIAIILENARLFTESQEAQPAIQRNYDEIGQADWEKIFGIRSNFGYYADKEHLIPLDEGSPGIEMTQLRDQSVLHLPIRIRGQVLGTIHARKLDAAGAWKPEETTLLETLTDQLSIALDNARLYRDAQRSAEREHIISDITAKVRASTNVNVILQTAIMELSEALRVSKATVQLYEDSDQLSANNPNIINYRWIGGDSHA